MTNRLCISFLCILENIGPCFSHTPTLPSESTLEGLSHLFYWPSFLFHSRMDGLVLKDIFGWGVWVSSMRSSSILSGFGFFCSKGIWICGAWWGWVCGTWSGKVMKLLNMFGKIFGLHIGEYGWTFWYLEASNLE